MMNPTEHMKHLSQLVQEAVDGTTDLKKSAERVQRLYAQEADRFDLPEDYPQQKVIADLIQMLDAYMKSSQELVKDPRALLLLRTITNQRLDQKANQLDQFARLPNPKEST